MISILKCNLQRLLSRKYYLIITIILTFTSIFAAVYFTSAMQVKGHIALVTSSPIEIASSKYLSITAVKSAPPMSDLVLGKYDAVITLDGGSYSVTTLRNDSFKTMILSALNDPKSFKPTVAQTGETRGIGANILGYLLMFLLIQSVLYMFTFAEDREGMQIERIAASPISFGRYLFAHSLFNFILTVAPAFFALCILRLFDFSLGFSLLQYLALLSIAGVFGTAFAIFMNAFIGGADNANMTGSTLVVLTTILAGSFYSFDKGHQVFEAVINILPQKDFLTFVQGLENGHAILSLMPQLIYLLLVTTLFFAAAVFKTHRNYIRRRS